MRKDSQEESFSRALRGKILKIIKIIKRKDSQEESFLRASDKLSDILSDKLSDKLFDKLSDKPKPVRQTV